MALLSPSFVLAFAVLLYLFTFVLFAILRISTGISIQRVGYLSLRRIAYTPQEGIRIEIRGLGLHLHRPTFARPTWISLRLSELKVTLDFKSISKSRPSQKGPKKERDEKKSGPEGKDEGSGIGSPTRAVDDDSPELRSRTWRKLTEVKEKIKSLHDKIHWLRMVDVEALNSSCVITDVGSVQVGSLTIAVDTRRRTVDRGRLFRHKKIPDGDRQPAEWLFVLKGALFTPYGKESLELVDICSLNVHGFIFKDLAGLREASISLKLGRIVIPFDDLVDCHDKIKVLQNARVSRPSVGHKRDVSFADMIEELGAPGTREEKIVQTVSESKEFISSLLRGIQEIQLAISFIGLSKEIQRIQPTGKPLFVNFSMNEFGIDLFRLDQKSPAHRMYFSSKDVAHQALLAAISIGISIDDGSSKPERILYIPMATTTIKTTLPSKTIDSVTERDTEEKNANILFANLVITSPSIDLDLKHMAIVLALAQRPRKAASTESSKQYRHHLLTRLLPKASIKISIQEPVARAVLPVSNPDPETHSEDDFDLLVSDISSISLDLESSHASTKGVHYALTSNLRITSQQLYYQSSSGHRHELLVNDACEVRSQINASPDISVVISGNLETFAIRMIRPETAKGLRKIIKQLRKDAETRTESQVPVSRLSFLRRTPGWLSHAQLKGTNFSVQVAGTDTGVSPDLRGVAFQLESWGAEYKSSRAVRGEGNVNLHRVLSNSASSREEARLAKTSTPTKSSDGRQLSTHAEGLRVYVIEDVEKEKADPFVSVPKVEMLFTASQDIHGMVFHTGIFIKSVSLHYSLYHYYSTGIAHSVLRKALVLENRGASRAESTKAETQKSQSTSTKSDSLEARTIDIKLGFLQAKGTMPSDPPVMLRAHNAEAGRHRWSAPFCKARSLRLYVGTPFSKRAWAHFVSIRNARLDLRESRRKTASGTFNEKSVDFSAEMTRIAIPHQLILNKVSDNFVNVVKATEQLHHRFMTGTDTYVLKKGPKPPKNVPRVSVRSRTLVFDIEDSSFEWKLGLIYRTGLKEQKQRLAREEAFRVKVKNMKDSTNSRERSSRSRLGEGRDQSRTKYSTKGGAGFDQQATPRATDNSSPQPRGRQMRYSKDASSGITGRANITTDQAWNRLQQHNAASWKRRINFAMKQHTNAMREIRAMFGAYDELTDVYNDSEVIVGRPERPGLMMAVISDFHAIIDKPSFPIQDVAKYLHNVGKGVPFDMQYDLLIPMSVQINMGESRCTLRDYPLPLIHVPGLKLGQSPRLPSWSLKTDFVIAEEWRDDSCIKHVNVEVVPKSKFLVSQDYKAGFFIDVNRTISPVKSYSDIDVSINTANPTSITWGTSYQPAIQDMMQIIEGFTKPQLDPSEKVGFWDKIRLSFHSRIRVAWRGDGDVHFKLKGSRDPYVVTGHGAGFIMCFRNNVQWEIHQDDDPKKFMAVSCGEYVLAIPDYSHHARQSNRTESGNDSESISSQQSNRENAIFQKVIMKLSGNVRWLAGLVFERDTPDGKGSFEFIPHYEIALKTPEHAKALKEKHDAFRGFRSDHIHLSIAVLAPVDRDWSVLNVTPSSSYNSIHLSPKFFTHFFDWWSLFSGVMALPIRQGKLFPGIEKSSKKFGRHLATIKYNLLLSPFFIAHVYKHKESEEYGEETVGATGLKVRIDSFMLDLHQRREEFETKGKGLLKTTRASAIKINKAQLDFISADIRAVSANIIGASVDEIKTSAPEDLTLSGHSMGDSNDFSKFKIPDEDYMWIDMDDFVELGWSLPNERYPETKIMPLAFSPRFTYFRQTDHHGVIAGDPGRTSRFGDEATHFCIMSHANDPDRVQTDLMMKRISVLEEQLSEHRRTLGDQELKMIREGSTNATIKEEVEMMQNQVKAIEERKALLESMLEQVQDRPDSNSWNSDDDSRKGAQSEANQTNGDSSEPLSDPKTDFNNRFIIHNIQLKWNNSLRNIILRYVHQVSQRRGFVYYMSRRAVKFILDIVEEQNKSKKKNKGTSSHKPSVSEDPSRSTSVSTDDDSGLQERIQDLLNDGKSFVNADDPRPSTSAQTDPSDIRKDISDEFMAQNSYHIRLISPQIQLQSEKNSKAVLLLTGKTIELKVIQIMDRSRLSDEVSGLVQRRFSVNMEDIQFFVTSHKLMSRYLHFYSANCYGSPKLSSWPPWAPIEVNFDHQINPFGWSRVVQQTSASMRFDKHNTLRLKYNDEVSKPVSGEAGAVEGSESRIDHLWVDFPRIRAICDSDQYFTIYIIVMDLLLYNEPTEKSRNERLEKIMLAADFSDLTGAPERVMSLQERIRQLEEIKAHFQINAKYLDRQGWHDRISAEQDLETCEDELFFMMKAITTSQRKFDDRSQSQVTGLLRWYLSASEIVWHLMKEKNDPLMEIQLQRALYERTDNSDGSNYNTVEIERIHGLNLLPNALYPEMIAPYFENEEVLAHHESIKMFKVQWHMLEAIAGIPVLDQFEVNLFPLKVQLEREIGKRLFEYIFPGNRNDRSASPYIIKTVPEEDDEPVTKTPLRARSSVVSTLSDQQSTTRPGALEVRLRPTFTLNDTHARPTSSSGRSKSTTNLNSDSHKLKPFQHRESISQTSLATRSEARRQSRESLRSLSKAQSEISASGSSDKTKKFGLNRVNSRDSGIGKEKASDDLTQMMSRASSYMTLAYVKIPSVVLCLSYKGRDQRNIEDVHEFVFRMPALEYRNKTWSNLDLALRLKKDVIKALISHTGAILGNKFSHHRPNKNQQIRLREVANSTSLLPNTTNLQNSVSKGPFLNPPSERGSSIWGSPMNRSTSDVSSVDGTRSTGAADAGTASDQDSVLEMNASKFKQEPAEGHNHHSAKDMGKKLFRKSLGKST